MRIKCIDATAIRRRYAGWQQRQLCGREREGYVDERLDHGDSRTLVSLRRKRVAKVVEDAKPAANDRLVAGRLSQPVGRASAGREVLVRRLPQRGAFGRELSSSDVRYL